MTASLRAQTTFGALGQVDLPDMTEVEISEDLKIVSHLPFKIGASGALGRSGRELGRGVGESAERDMHTGAPTVASAYTGRRTRCHELILGDSSLLAGCARGAGRARGLAGGGTAPTRRTLRAGARTAIF